MKAELDPSGWIGVRTLPYGVYQPFVVLDAFGRPEQGILTYSNDRSLPTNIVVCRPSGGIRLRAVGFVECFLTFV